MTNDGGSVESIERQLSKLESTATNLQTVSVLAARANRTQEAEDIAIRTSASYVSDWYADCGFYSSVSFNRDKTPAAIEAIAKAPNNHIALAIRVELIDPTQTGGHMIALESPIIINAAADTASFDYWTWGRRIRPRNTTWTDLQKYYRSSIVATF